MLVVLVVLGVLAVVFLLGVAWLSQQRKLISQKNKHEPSCDAPQQQPVDWVFLHSYLTADTAYIDRAFLEGCGVPTTLKNEMTVATNWLYGVAVGIDLMVPRELWTQASELLGDQMPPSAAADLQPEEGQADIEERCCGACGSAEVYRARRGRGWSLTVLLLLGLPLWWRRYRCDRCGETA